MSSESFDLCVIETGLRQTMMDGEVSRVLRHIRSARACRLIEANSAETKRLIDECKHLKGSAWVERQDRITELFKEHARLCTIWDANGPRDENS